tara:strand:+ start:29 stop:229 length:201 start_codon:yes stop_codon:yes gene_type:complete
MQFHYNIDKFEDIELDGIDTNDYPDFSNAFISDASYNGDKATPEQLDWLEDHLQDDIHQMVIDKLF